MANDINPGVRCLNQRFTFPLDVSLQTLQVWRKGPALRSFTHGATSFTILIYGSPGITLLAINLDEHLINEKGITISLVFSTQPGCVFRSELVAPQSN